MGNESTRVSRSRSNSQTNQSSESPKGKCERMKEWVKLNPRETAFIAVNVALVLGVILMGIIGSTTGHGISFQDMVSEKGWKITAGSAGALIGADLIVGGIKLNKIRQRAKVESSDKPFEAPAAETESADPIPAAPEKPKPRKHRK